MKYYSFFDHLYMRYEWVKSPDRGSYFVNAGGVLANERCKGIKPFLRQFWYVFKWDFRIARSKLMCLKKWFWAHDFSDE